MGSLHLSRPNPYHLSIPPSLPHALSHSTLLVLLLSLQELLGLELLGVIPESKCILTATNIGQPVICMPDQDAGQGEDRERGGGEFSGLPSNNWSYTMIYSWMYTPCRLPPPHSLHGHRGAFHGRREGVPFPEPQAHGHPINVVFVSIGLDGSRS